jgi:hypothetical protein
LREGALECAGAVAGQRASLWSAAQRCLQTLASLRQLRSALACAAKAQQTAKDSEADSSETLAEARQRESAWQSARLDPQARAGTAQLALSALAQAEALLSKALAEPSSRAMPPA